ncbi:MULTISPECIES: TetR/AcrR family transcriptional regulator [unclassified Streptomyces]|uniref:TetR/AcrR family transcriptional regulator n=1 Tax=unclassified Streptomyces TaxID=2593676 RepID=UPI000BE2E2E6|nr:MULTISPECIES: TetR family transcriptional regulator [unclassified Streptomyces]
MTAPRTTLADQPSPGLRERKKTKTRRAIRTATYALIEEQGYDATTIEQIADRAEVSPSTVFRYFPAKEDIVVTDAWDPVMTAELRARPADEPWADTLRHVMRTALDQALAEEPAVTRLRTRLGVEVPAVRARMLENAAATGRLLRDALAERSGLDPDSLELRVFTMSVMGGLTEVSHYWAETGHRDDIRDLVDRALDVLEHGLPAGKP